MLFSVHWLLLFEISLVVYDVLFAMESASNPQYCCLNPATNRWAMAVASDEKYVPGKGLDRSANARLRARQAGQQRDATSRFWPNQTEAFCERFSNFGSFCQRSSLHLGCTQELLTLGDWCLTTC